MIFLAFTKMFFENAKQIHFSSYIRIPKFILMRSFKLLLIALCSLFLSDDLSAQQLNFSWANAMGAPNILGSASVVGIVVTHDASGNVFVSGTLRDTADFDPGPGTFWMSSTSAYDVFIAKFNMQGALVWAKTLPGIDTEGPVGIVTTSSGDVLLVCQFTTDIDVNPDPAISNIYSSFGNEDIVLVKMDAAGSFVWAKQLGGPSGDFPTMLRSDGVGNIYISGFFRDSMDVDPSANIVQLRSNGLNDGFLLKMDAQGVLLWAHSFGSTAWDDVTGFDVKANGDVIACGTFINTVDFDPSATVSNLTAPANTNGTFLLHLTSAGLFSNAKALLPLNQNSHVNATHLELDNADKIYLSGNYNGIVDLNPNVTILDSSTSVGNSQDIFLVKLADIQSLDWKRTFGNSNIDLSSNCLVKSPGHVFLKGSVSGSIDINPSPVDSFIIVSSGGPGNRSDYILALDDLGNFAWGAKTIGSSVGYRGNSIDMDQTRFYHTGQFTGTNDFDPGPGVFNLSGTTGTGTAFLSQLINSPVGLNENANQHPIYIFPNPTTDVLNFYSEESLHDADVFLYTMNAQIVKSLYGMNGNSFSISVEGFAAGMYVLQIHSEKGPSSYKIVIGE